MPTGAPRTHVVVITHTTRHLPMCLHALAWQTVRPRTVCVSCDVDDPGIGAAIAGALARGAPVWDRAPRPRVLWARRAHAGVARVNQVRNNAVRALDRAHALDDDDLIVVIDGDVCLASDALAAHAGAAVRGGDAVIAWRRDLDQDSTADLTEDALVRAPIESVVGSCDAPGSRARRIERQARLRRLGMGWAIKAHKPKILGGHHAVRVGLVRRLNGYDERYEGYGFDDDDLARRIHAAGAPVRVRVRQARAVHLWHPSRAGTAPEETSGYRRFAQTGWTVRAEVGLTTPAPQSDLMVSEMTEYEERAL